MTPSCSGSDRFVLLNFSACHNRDLCLCQHLFRQLRLSGDLKTFYSKCYALARSKTCSATKISVSLPTPAQLAQTPYTRVQTHRKPQNTCSPTIGALRQLSLSNNCRSPRRSARDNCRRRPNSKVTMRWVAGGQRAIVISS